MPSRTVFISDLHLTPERNDITQAFLQFLQTHAQNIDALYILGDFFESWVGDDDDAELPATIARALNSCASTGTAIYIMCGNRDFLLGRRYCESAGATLLDDPCLIDLYGTATLLLHGDTLCTDDTDYLAFRAIARDPAWQQDVLSKTLAERRTLAAHLRAASKESTSNKAEDITDVAPSEVLRVMEEHAVNQIIHGHTHRPTCHHISSGRRWVLGDWDQKGWYIEASAQSIELKSFIINKPDKDA